MSILILVPGIIAMQLISDQVQVITGCIALKSIFVGPH